VSRQEVGEGDRRDFNPVKSTKHHAARRVPLFHVGCLVGTNSGQKPKVLLQELNGLGVGGPDHRGLNTNGARPVPLEQGEVIRVGFDADPLPASALEEKAVAEVNSVKCPDIYEKPGLCCRKHRVQQKIFAVLAEELLVL